MSIVTLLIVILLVLLIAGAARNGNVNFSWPGGLLGTVLLILLVLFLLGYR